MKRLTIDIETAPAVAHVWNLFNVNVSLAQLQEPGRMISFAAKWYGSPKVEFYSEFHHGKETMVEKAHSLLSDADVLIHYNGTLFDVPHLQREFVLAGLERPSPFLQIDLLRVVRKQFRFQSNKLQHVSTQLGLEGKTQHSGHGLWVQCLAGDAKAWNTMRKYNRQDVVLTEKLYERLLPWITNHPSVPLHAGSDEEACGSCGGTSLQRRGQAVTLTGVYGRLQCQGCGSWSRYTKRELGAPVVGLR